MSISFDRYHKAISRNLAELQKAILIRTSLLGIEDHGAYGHTFTRVVRDALFDQYMAHCIKVFENSSQASSFWYIHKTDERPISAHASSVGVDLADIVRISEKLKIIRDGTHFHLDSTGVLDPRAIWTDADLTGKELSAAVDFAWGALTKLQQSLGLPEAPLLGYTRGKASAAVARIGAE